MSLPSSLPPALLIDLDDTILAFGRREALLEDVAGAFAAAAAPLTPAELACAVETAFIAFWADPERLRRARFRPLDEMRRLIIADLFEHLSAVAPGLTREVAIRFADTFHDRRENGAAPFPGAIEAVDALRKRGIKLALVTNGRSLIQRAKIARLGLEERFHHIQIEEEHGFGKPDERAYRHALRALDAAPHECWMVGDNLEWEVAAPQRLGIAGIWLDGYGRGLPEGSTVRPDRIICNLMELLE